MPDNRVIYALLQSSAPPIQLCRKHLIEAGVIKAPRRNELVFAVTCLEEYLLGQKDYLVELPLGFQCFIMLLVAIFEHLGRISTCYCIRRNVVDYNSSGLDNGTFPYSDSA